jgi:hypothetical protein
MSEAVELFVRRVIIDKRIPFEIVALDASGIEGKAAGIPGTNGHGTADRNSSSGHHVSEHPAKEKIEKTFSAGVCAFACRSRKTTKTEADVA